MTKRFPLPRAATCRTRIVHPIELYMIIWSETRLCKYFSVYRDRLRAFIAFLDEEHERNRRREPALPEQGEDISPAARAPAVPDWRK
jgi:hypothetical protein